jgi:hypothetical protein
MTIATSIAADKPFRNVRNLSSAGVKIAKARQILAALVRRHVWLEKDPRRTQGAPLRFRIAFGAEPYPEGGSSPVPITLPMIGWMIGRCHSTLSDAIRRTDLDAEIEAAEKILAAG